MMKPVLILLSAFVWANAEFAFLGIQPHLEPKLSRLLEKKIRQQIFDVTENGLLPLRKTEGELWHFRSFPLDMNDEKLRAMLTKIGARQVMVGELGGLTMSYARTWWRPWRGDVELRYRLKLQIFDGDHQKTLYLGELKSRASLENIYLGKDPKLTKLDAVDRHNRSVEILDSLAMEVRQTLQGLLPLMKAQAESGGEGGGSVNSPAPETTDSEGMDLDDFLGEESDPGFSSEFTPEDSPDEDVPPEGSPEDSPGEDVPPEDSPEDSPGEDVPPENSPEEPESPDPSEETGFEEEADFSEDADFDGN